METTHSPKSGSVIGAILLVAGCCIGAGMLGMPVMSALAGFGPSLAMFLLSWLFMTTTALLLLEVNLWFSHEVSIISMAGHTLGFAGKAVAWSCYAFLFYTLGIAYIAGSGELLANFTALTFGMPLPHWVGSLSVSLLFGLFVYLGTRAVDLFNRLLMAGLVLTYILLVCFGLPHVRIENITYVHWSAAPFVIPVMIISFGFHNLIPSLTTYLKGNTKLLRLTIIGGSLSTLIVYLIWEFVILGLIPLSEQQGLVKVIDQNNMATGILSKAVGSSLIVQLTQSFAFFAIVTSFLANSLSFVDFLADGFRIKKTSFNKLWLCVLVIAPPFILAMIYPQIFLVALNYAGAFGAVILFGILPALMVWAGRYKLNLSTQVLVPGGKITLSLIVLFSLWVMWLYI
ncbi:MAG: aromatic amino acid transport family protein [Parachlamydiaceae bacterium]